MRGYASIRKQDLLVAAVVLIVGLPFAGYSADAGTDHQAKRAPALYLSEGINESQVQAVIADIGSNMPDGAAVWIGLVTSPNTESGDVAEWGPSGGVPDGFAIHPLDDPNNPYLNQYAPWDKWEYENYQQLAKDYGIGSMTDQERWAFYAAHSDDPRLDSTQGHRLTVSGDGFVIPQVVAKSSVDTGGEGSVLSFGSVIPFSGAWLGYQVYNAFSFASGGKMADDMWAQLQQAVDVARAPHLPAIPKWMADNPPMWLMFIPEDEFVTLGPLGSWNDQSALSKSEWFCFNRAGEIVGQTTPGQQWWFEMFFPKFRQTWDELGGIPDVQFDDALGMIRFYRLDTHEDLAYYDYHGTQLTSPFGDSASDYFSPSYLFDIFEGRHIPAMYEAQQK